jgi:hypothetical protein
MLRARRFPAASCETVPADEERSVDRLAAGSRADDHYILRFAVIARSLSHKATGR